MCGTYEYKEPKLSCWMIYNRLSEYCPFFRFLLNYTMSYTQLGYLTLDLFLNPSILIDRAVFIEAPWLDYRAIRDP